MYFSTFFPHFMRFLFVVLGFPVWKEWGGGHGEWLRIMRNYCITVYIAPIAKLKSKIVILLKATRWQEMHTQNDHTEKKTVGRAHRAYPESPYM